MLRIACFLAMSALLMPPLAAMPLEPDQFPDAPRAILHMRMEIGGFHRWDSANGLEHTTLRASRTADLRLLMVLTDESRAPPVPIRGHDLTNPELPEAQQTVTNMIEACNGDPACQIEAAKRYADAIEAAPDGFGTTEWDDERYDNWISDRSKPCATGTLTIADSGGGMVVNPPAPVSPFSYSRSGVQDVKSAPDDVLNRICDAWFSYDIDDATASIRLPAYGFWVDTLFGGDYQGEQHLQLIEGGPSFVFSLDRASAWNGGGSSGTFTVPAIGVASLSGGQSVSLDATISWSLSPELQ